MPAAHSASIALYLSIEILYAVGRLKAPAKLFEYAKLVKRQGFLQPLIQTGNRRLVDELEFLTDRQQLSLCLGIGRLEAPD